MTGAAASLTGCSPAQKGLTGVTVDQAGRPVAVLKWCEGDPPDGVVFYPEPPEPPEPTASEATSSSSRPSSPAPSSPAPSSFQYQSPAWKFRLKAEEEPSGRYAEVPLDAPPEDWSTSGPPLGALARGQVYVLKGAYRDINKMFSSIEVTAASLARIRPGIVMTRGFDPKTRKLGELHQTRAEFLQGPPAPHC